MQDASLAFEEPPQAAQELRGLSYPFGRWTPEHGKLHPVADGVFWLRMPLPFSLNHINLWVLDDGAGWAIVDTGLAAPSCRDLWRALFEGPMAGRPVTRVIVTHYHPDHLGLAGWLTHKWGVPLEMTRGEYLLARVLTLDIEQSVAPKPSTGGAVRFLEGAGTRGTLELVGRDGRSLLRSLQVLPRVATNVTHGDASVLKAQA